MTGSLVSADETLGKVSWAVDKMTTKDVCFACLAWLYELLVGMLISLMKTYAGCGRPTLNVTSILNLVAPFRTAKPVLCC